MSVNLIKWSPTPGDYVYVMAATGHVETAGMIRRVLPDGSADVRCLYRTVRVPRDRMERHPQSGWGE